MYISKFQSIIFDGTAFLGAVIVVRSPLRLGDNPYLVVASKSHFEKNSSILLSLEVITTQAIAKICLSLTTRVEPGRKQVLM